MTKYLQSAFKIKSSGVILCSRHVHDFYGDEREPDWFIDGGLHYLRVLYPSTIPALDWENAIESLAVGPDTTEEQYLHRYVFKINKQYKLIKECTKKELKDIKKYLEKYKIDNTTLYETVCYWLQNVG